MSPSFTCVTCRVHFKLPETQREHYKSDWHRYNLKRKITSASPVTSEEYNKRVLEHREATQKVKRNISEYCEYCSKSFNTKNTYNNHLNSRKHKLTVKTYVEREQKEEEQSVFSDTSSFVKVFPKNDWLGITKPDKSAKFVVLNPNDSGNEDIETDSEMEELNSDEWEECRITGSDSLIKPQDCLFCDHHSKSIVKNLKHMLHAHSFFIPDVEYCVDMKGLLLYLGEKISQGFMCIWCNEKSKIFYSLEAVRSHMIDKGHCMMLHEGIALAEYSEFYDYSSSYPDYKDDKNMDVDEEVEAPATLDGEDFEMVLPSGVVVGHRSLMRYYKQNLTHNSQALVKKSDRKVHKLIGLYRAIGWSGKEEAAVARKARDIHFMKRVQAKWQLKLSTKANKFQKHYRPQVNF